MAFDAHSRFAVNGGKGKASGEKRIGAGPVAWLWIILGFPHIESIVLNLKRQHLIRKVPILPYDSRGGHPRAAGRRQGEVSN
jgi:hypothetical protein